MLHIVAWLAVYAVVLFTLGHVIRPWRTRGWFKALFLPGVLIAIGVQAAAARLCVGGRYKTAPLKKGEFAFSIEKDVPCLAGALFVFVSHALFYALFFFTVRQLETFAGFEVDAIALPGLHPHQVLEGTIEVDLRAYLASLRRSVEQLVANPLPIWPFSISRLPCSRASSSTGESCSGPCCWSSASDTRCPSPIISRWGFLS